MNAGNVEWRVEHGAGEDRRRFAGVATTGTVGPNLVPDLQFVERLSSSQYGTADARLGRSFEWTIGNLGQFGHTLFYEGLEFARDD